jgi:type III restriction enzyme
MSIISPKGYQADAVGNALELFRYVESQFQQASDDQSRRAISAFNGCVLLEAPTGAGKTLMAGLIAETFSRNNHHHNANIIWIWFTPFVNLVEQAKRALRKDFAGLKICDLSTERVAYKANSGDVFVTTWASVAARNAETRVLRKTGDLSLSLDEFIPELRENGFRIGVVIDEAHHTFTKDNEAVKFYRDILSPEYTLLITATPDDSDVDKFKKAAGIEEIHKIQVSRESAVDEGLIKEAVKSIAYLLPDTTDKGQAFIDLELTALEDGWRTQLAIKKELANLKIRLTPLMLVQIDSKGKSGEEAVEKTKQRLIEIGVPEEAIAWYTADDPNDDLLTVARDESKEVLIFKVAAALGFDAPRAFTLVSLRSTKSIDFGIQVVGRILRVDSKLQAMAATRSLPEILRFGYVFLADIEAQGGLIGAADKINAIQTQMSAISPNTIIVKIAGQTEVQVSHNGELSLLSNPYIPPTWKDTKGADNNKSSLSSEFSQETVSLFEDFILPNSTKVEDIKQPSYRPLITGNRNYPLQEVIPLRFKSERIMLGTEDMVKQIVVMAKLDDAVLNAGLRKYKEVTRQTISIFNQTDKLVETIQARLSANEINQRAQRVLFEAEFIDPRDLNEELFERLKSEYNKHRGLGLSDDEVERALQMILALYPKLIRNATNSCMAQLKEVYDTAELPKEMEASDAIERARLGSYGIIPSDLNETERKFARLLETDTGNTVKWWHRNEDRKPHSVGIVLPNGHRYFPDFLIGINNRSRGEGILLVEIKGGHILKSDDTLEKLNAEHKVYGKPLLLTLHDDGQFWIVRYIESTNQVEKDQVFRVENMGQY